MKVCIIQTLNPYIKKIFDAALSLMYIRPVRAATKNNYFNETLIITRKMIMQRLSDFLKSALICLQVLFPPKREFDYLAFRFYSPLFRISKPIIISNITFSQPILITQVELVLTFFDMITAFGNIHDLKILGYRET